MGRFTSNFSGLYGFNNGLDSLLYFLDFFSVLVLNLHLSRYLSVCLFSFSLVFRVLFSAIIVQLTTLYGKLIR